MDVTCSERIRGDFPSMTHVLEIDEKTGLYETSSGARLGLGASAG